MLASKLLGAGGGAQIISKLSFDNAVSQSLPVGGGNVQYVSNLYTEEKGVIKGGFQYNRPVGTFDIIQQVGNQTGHYYIVGSTSVSYTRLVTQPMSLIPRKTCILMSFIGASDYAAIKGGGYISGSDYYPVSLTNAGLVWYVAVSGGSVSVSYRDPTDTAISTILGANTGNLIYLVVEFLDVAKTRANFWLKAWDFGGGNDYTNWGKVFSDVELLPNPVHCVCTWTPQSRIQKVYDAVIFTDGPSANYPDYFDTLLNPKLPLL